MKQTLGKFVDYTAVILCAFLFFQFPLFIQQYKLQLIGHVDELQWHVKAMQERATKGEKTVDQYVQKFVVHSDPDFSEQGKSMQQLVDRWEALSTALFQITHASLFTRPMHFLRTLQWDIFTATAEAFEPGFLVTSESLLYAFLGMVIGHMIANFLRNGFRRFSQRSANQVP